MQLKKLLSEDDAVSPVIGVILMVAITVILAAVIASFVLGLGDTADEVQPNASFSLDNLDNEGDGPENVELTITLTDGDTIDFEEIVLRGSALAEDISQDDIDGDETWNVGQSVTFGEDADNDYDLDDLAADDGWTTEEGEVTMNIVWEEAGGDNSATLASYDFVVDDGS